jgi:hypothetical protein
MTETRTIRDSNGRTIECELVRQVEIDGQAIGVMAPVDAPVLLYINGKDGARDLAVDPWWEHPEKVKALGDKLKKDGVELVLSAVTLTARAKDLEMDWSGDPDPSEVDDDEDDEGPGGDDTHAVLVEVDGQYGLAIPIDPLLFLAALDEHGGVALDEAADRGVRTRFAAMLLEPAQ